MTNDEIDLDVIEADAVIIQAWDHGGLAGSIPGTLRALIAEIRRLRVMIPCGRGNCASHHDHDGTCAQASGWDETNEQETR
jgi:hypothetical protein